MRLIGESGTGNGGDEQSTGAAAQQGGGEQQEHKGNGAAKDPGAELAQFAKSQQEKKDSAKKAKPKGGKKKGGGVKAQAAAAEKKGEKAKAKKAAAKPAGKSKGTPKQGIGAFCEGLLKQKKSTDEIMKAVQAKFPGAKTSPASIAWYRSKMREEGTLPKA